MNHLARLSITVLCALLLLAVPARAQETSCAGLERLSRTQLADILHRGQFSGTMDDAASVRFAGCAGEPSRELGVFYYARTFGNGRMSQRLIFVSGARGYLGMYAVENPPRRVTRTRVVFPGTAPGNSIVIHAGTPPKQAWIDGEVLTLFR